MFSKKLINYVTYLCLCIASILSEHPKVLRRRDLGVKYPCSNLYLEILVSPVVGDNEVRRLEIQWENARMQNGDWIGLFRRDPLNSIQYNNVLPPVLWTTGIPSQHGWLKTTVLEEHTEDADLGYKPRCLDYYAAYLDQYNNTLRATCLRIEPNWMWDLRPEIGNTRIKALFIPGTHDASAYGEHDADKGDTRVRKYSVTQDETVLGQLIHGVRYLDVRVGYYPSNNEEFWGNHGIAKLHPLRIILRDVIRFLDNTQEVVILDIQEFPVGFGNTADIHRKLVHFLDQEIGRKYAVSPTVTYDGTLNEVWRTGRRLIIGYDNRQMVMESSFLWPPVNHQWGNVQKVSALYKYIAGILERPPRNSWAAMAELTPTTIDVLLDKFKGLRKAAELVNHNLTEWYRRESWSSKSNVVAVDFVRGSGIVRAAIEWNKFRGCPP